MADSTNTRMKLLGSMTADTAVQKIAEEDISRAVADAAAAKAVWDASEARLASIRAVRDKDLANIATRRNDRASLISPFATTTVDAVDVEALLRPYQLQPIPGTVPTPPGPAIPSLPAFPAPPAYSKFPVANAESSPSITDLDRSSADDQTEEDDDDDDDNKIPTKLMNAEGRYLNNCSAVAQNNSNQWVEIRCYECGINCDPTRKDFFKGSNGIQRHLAQAHKERISRAAAIAKCTKRVVPLSEVKKLASGALALQKIITDVNDGHNPGNRRRSVQRRTAAPKKDRASTASTSSRKDRQSTVSQSSDTKPTPPADTISRRSTKNKLGQIDPRHGLTTDSLKYLKLLTGSKSTTAALKIEGQKASKEDRDRFKRALQEKQASVHFNTSQPMARVPIPGASGPPYLFHRWDAEGQASYQARATKVKAAEAKTAEREAEGYEVPESDSEDDSDLSSVVFVGRGDRVDSLVQGSEAENGKMAASESTAQAPHTTGMPSSSDDDSGTVQGQREKGKKRAADYDDQDEQNRSKRPRLS